MYAAIIYTLISFAYLNLSFFLAPTPKKAQNPVATLSKKEVIKPQRIQTAPKKIGTLDHRIALMKVSFDNLPGWDDTDVKKSLAAFQVSCKKFMQQNPKHLVGSSRIKLQAGDWQPACDAAQSVDPNSEVEARNFFEKWFNPIEFKQQKKATHGVFTGYYTPQFEGSLTRTTEFKTPIYGLPRHLKWDSHGKMKPPYFTREQIDNGILDKKAPVIAWIKDPIDRLSLEIEGAGVIQLDDGEKVYLGYAGENGAPYTSIGHVLIKSGVMTKDNASRAAITRYLHNHPEKINPILHRNKSFVFFQRVNRPMALGAQGTALTPGYSLAIDKKWIPMGVPLWLNFNNSDTHAQDKQFHRLMIAQDTGGAIRGVMRGDVYWGSGEKATYLGEHMKKQGRYWMLLPKFALKRLVSKLGAISV